MLSRVLVFASFDESDSVAHTKVCMQGVHVNCRLGITRPGYEQDLTLTIQKDRREGALRLPSLYDLNLWHANPTIRPAQVAGFERTPALSGLPALSGSPATEHPAPMALSAYWSP